MPAIVSKLLSAGSAIIGGPLRKNSPKTMTANELYHRLQEQLYAEDIETLKGILNNNPIPPGSLEKLKSFMDICFKLEEMNYIRPDRNDFEFLKKQLKRMQKNKLVDMITEHEQRKH